MNLELIKHGGYSYRYDKLVITGVEIMLQMIQVEGLMLEHGSPDL
jgi:hypothetical protein